MDEGLANKKVKDTESIVVKNTLKSRLLNGKSQFNWQLQAPFNFVEKGDVEALRNFVQDSFYEQTDIQGNSLMHHAARLDNPEVAEKMVKELIHMNVPVNGTNKMGRTPLHVAVEQNNLFMVRKLLQEGADPNQGDINGVTPTHTAARCADVPVLRVLRSHGANFNAVDKWGMTPLFNAASANKPVVVAELMLFGCDVNATDKVGNTALFYAAWIGHKNVVRILCFYGADTLSQNKHGKTPVDIAKAEGFDDIVAFMSRYTPSASMNRLIEHIENRTDEIRKLFENLPKNIVYANDVKYSMIRASARLMEVEKFLQSLSEHTLDQKAHQSLQKVTGPKPIVIAKENEPHTNE